MNKRKIRLYNIFGKGYHYETPMSNTDRIVAASLLVGLAGLSFGLQLGSNWGSEPSAQASEPVEAIKSVSVSTESVIVAVVDTEPVLVPLAVSEKEQIIAYIVEVFGEDAPDAFSVLHCENRGLNPQAVNHNRNGTKDLGIFQLNTAYWGGEENFDWKTNIDKAYMIFERAGKKFTPWTCSHRIGQKNYLGK